MYVFLFHRKASHMPLYMQKYYYAFISKPCTVTAEIVLLYLCDNWHMRSYNYIEPLLLGGGRRLIWTGGGDPRACTPVSVTV